MECPRCKGKKKTPCFKGRGLIDLTCNLCDGKGVVSKKHKEWAKEGDKLRDDRIARRMTLRKEAKRREIDVQILSDMEIGKIKPIKK